MALRNLLFKKVELVEKKKVFFFLANLNFSGARCGMQV